MTPDDAGNPGGYKPDDPRYGLSGEALRAYYRNKPPQFFIKALYAPGKAGGRAAALEPHMAYIRAHTALLRFAGPPLGDDRAEHLRTMFLLDLPDRPAAEAFIPETGYTQTGPCG